MALRLQIYRRIAGLSTQQQIDAIVDVAWRTYDEYHKSPRSLRQWCKLCGGHLMTEHPTMKLTDVYAAILPKLKFSPGLHVFYEETVLRIPDGKPKQKDEARRYLAKANAAHRFSDALSVAYDLQFSSSCAARLPEASTSTSMKPASRSSTMQVPALRYFTRCS